MTAEYKASLTETFSRYFSVDIVNTREQKEHVFRIRYLVYCEEFKYEAVENFPDQMEIDEYDRYSRHCLVTHRETGIPAGCVRLVPALGDRETTPLPLEKYCSDSLDHQSINAMMLERQSVCEISRLAVASAFRRRSGEELTRFGKVDGVQFSQEEQRTFPSIAVACFFAATVLTEIENRTNAFAMMEPFLARMMHRSGIYFQRIGKDIDYHGVRAPYFITTQAVLQNIRPELRELYEWIKDTSNYIPKTAA